MSPRKACKSRGQQCGEDTCKMPPAGRQAQRAQARGAAAAGPKKQPGPNPKTLGAARRGRRRARSLVRSRAVSARKTGKSRRSAARGGYARDAAQPAMKKQAEQGAAGAEAPQEAEQLQLQMPRELKAWLITDWDLVTKRQHLYQLPAAKNIDELLGEYAAYRAAQGGATEEYEVSEVLARIKQYFNLTLPTQLLCKFEKPQHAEILVARPNVPMSQIYGAPHLLRLFTRVAGMVAASQLDDANRAPAMAFLQDFLHYLAHDAASLFTTRDYKVASAEYIQKAL